MQIIEKTTNVRTRHMRERESGKSRIKAPELIRQGIGIGDMEIDILGAYPFLDDIQPLRRCVDRDMGGMRCYELGPIAGSASHFEDAPL